MRQGNVLEAATSWPVLPASPLPAQGRSWGSLPPPHSLLPRCAAFFRVSLELLSFSLPRVCSPFPLAFSRDPQWPLSPTLCIPFSVPVLHAPLLPPSPLVPQPRPVFPCLPTTGSWGMWAETTRRAVLWTLLCWETAMNGLCTSQQWGEI